MAACIGPRVVASWLGAALGLAAQAAAQIPPNGLPPARAVSPAATPAAAAPPSLLAPPAGLLSSPPAAAAGAPSPGAIAEPKRDLTPVDTADVRPGLKVTKGSGVLPNEHGQIWREYDISPYTLRVADSAQPQQALIDWILRETGTEVWFVEPLGILSASRTTLRVYHTPEMHDRVRGIVERFVGGDVEAHELVVRLMTVGSPNWRNRALALLKPVEVKSAGMEAWVLSRENAVLLYEQLKARGDFREHSAPQTQVVNGQTQTLSRIQPRSYTRTVQLKREYPFYSLLPGQIDEGYTLKISPLLSLDGQTMEVALDCRIDQIEKLVPLAMDVPVGGQSQRVQVQVPQIVSWRMNERFRWPANEVLLLSCGVVANPAPGSAGPLSLLSPLGLPSSRADALLLVEHREKVK